MMKVSEVKWFKYLKTVLQKDNVFEKYVNRIKCGWMKWRQISGKVE